MDESTARKTSVMDLQLIMNGQMQGGPEEFQAWQEGLVTYGELGVYEGKRLPPMLTEEGARLLGITVDRT